MRGVTASREGLKRAGVVAGLAITLTAAVACGGGGETPAQEGFLFRKVAPSDQTYDLEDFLDVGFKKSKQYDVTGLPGGVDAYMGFFGPDPYNRKQYELRFYASHQDAVEQGTPPAEEVTGEDAAEYRLNPTWKEGAKDRWTSGAPPGPTTGTLSSGPAPKYGDFAIFGNVLMLCEGADSGQGLERCEALVRALAGADAE